jgi:hypothetical protein
MHFKMQSKYQRVHKSSKIKKPIVLEGFLGRLMADQPDRILSKDDDYKMSAFQIPSLAFTSTNQDIAEHFIETHFPGCQLISELQS